MSSPDGYVCPRSILLIDAGYLAGFYAPKGGECLDPITLFYTGVVVGIYCWKKAKRKVKEGD